METAYIGLVTCGLLTDHGWVQADGEMHIDEGLAGGTCSITL
jgi:hypothetical protein